VNSGRALVGNQVADHEEHFVDATVAAAFLSITRKCLLKLSRMRIAPPPYRSLVSNLEGLGSIK
jgi:hypothetical protein